MSKVDQQPTPVPTDQKMDPELKAKWLEALRSGKYEQGRGSLCYDGKHCCLGVLQDVVGKDQLPRHHLGWEYLDYDQAAPIGLTEIVQQNLGRLNDEMKGFGMVADYIEANL